MREICTVIGIVMAGNTLLTCLGRTAVERDPENNPFTAYLEYDESLNGTWDEPITPEVARRYLRWLKTRPQRPVEPFVQVSPLPMWE